MPVVGTKGAMSSQGFGEFAKANGVANYIEDVFSTYLYTGTGASQTITNGIDLSTKGGMVWVKSRSNAYNNAVIDTDRGMTYSNYRPLFTNLTDAQGGPFTNIMQANADGFSYGTSGTGTAINSNGATYASWTFRKQPKFFDVVTWTGDGTINRAISHNLQSIPGMVITKSTSTTGDWWTLNRTNSGWAYMKLNTTDASPIYGAFNTTTPADASAIYINNGGIGGGQPNNVVGVTYVAYLFAHNAGGFGLTGTDNVITCGSYTGTGATGNSIYLGYEPQFLMFKVTNDVSDWAIADVMRGMTYSGTTWLYPDGTYADDATTSQVVPTATGFTLTGSSNACNGASKNYIYIAIRRGPMKVPTSGTNVYNAQQGQLSSGSAGQVFATAGFPLDAALQTLGYPSTGGNHLMLPRLTSDYNITNTTDQATNTSFIFASNVGLAYASTGYDTTNRFYHMFKRAPSFMDVVCYTANLSTGTAVAHNLGVAPELVICKSRSASPTDGGWQVWSAYTSNSGSYLNTTAAFSAGFWASGISPTSTSVYADYQLIGSNGSNIQQIAYLFATCAGVSKVGTYSGTGATQTISCGFTGGARFVLIKRTNSTGDWYVWDTTRGMVSGTDPSFLLNSTAAQVNANSIYTTTGGFQIVSTAAGINASGGTYLYLAIA